MNAAHLSFLASDDWARWLEAETLPWLDRLGDLGDHVLEIGPGPGLTTDLLRTRTARLTAVEIDQDLAAALAVRLAGTNVEVIEMDATDTGLPPGSFSAAACFSMLHHVPAEAQDRLFAEAHRVLRPGALFAAVDSVDHEAIRRFHEGDVFVPIDPGSLEGRLAAAGFPDASVEAGQFELRFHARKPG